MGKPELGGGVADLLRLRRVERAGQPGPHVAEGAGPRAGVAHDHEGGVLLRPALADIGAAGLLADGDEAVLADDVRRLAEDRRCRRLDPDPVRFPRNRRVGTMRLFRMPRARAARFQRIDDDDHQSGRLSCPRFHCPPNHIVDLRGRDHCGARKATRQPHHPLDGVRVTSLTTPATISARMSPKKAERPAERASAGRPVRSVSFQVMLTASGATSLTSQSRTPSPTQTRKTQTNAFFAGVIVALHVGLRLVTTR